jgi:hypothetical protein
MSPDETRADLAFQRRLLDSYTQNYRITEEQISQFAPALVPVHLLRQRDAFEAKRTELLATIRELEQTLGPQGPTAAAGPAAATELVLDVVPTGVLHLYTQE